jgi:hypothetical protein
MKSIAAFVLAMTVLSIPVAHADDGLPSDFGPVSIEASRRALRADIQDWTDDQLDIKARRILSCAAAGAQGMLLSSGQASAMAAMAMLGKLPSYLSGPASAPLSTPMAELERVVPFTEAEKQNLDRLKNRPVSDLTDRIRLAIDTESFLLKVSARLYQELMDYHLRRTQGFVGFFRADVEYCAAYSLQAERDAELTRAAQRMLAFYDFLEQELAN